jgi:hypothetical protein
MQIKFDLQVAQAGSTLISAVSECTLSVVEGSAVVT